MTTPTKTLWNFQHEFWEHLIFFCILIGILPGIDNYSLFFLDLNIEDFSLAFLDFKVEDTRLIRTSDFTWYTFGLGILSLPLMLFLCYRRKEYGHLIGLSPYFVYLFFLFLVLSGILSDNTNDPLLDDILNTFFKIAFLYFVHRGRILSWSFWLFLALIYTGLSPIKMFLFAGTALLFRFLILLIWQNLSILKPLGLLRLIQIFFRSLLLWSPMLLVVIPSFYLTQYMEQQSVEAMYDNTFLHQVGEEKHFEQDLKYSLDSVYNLVKDTLHMKVAATKGKLTDLEREVPGAAAATIKNSVVPPKVDVKINCKWYQLGCHLGKGASKSAARATETAFAASVNKMADGVEGQLTTVLGEFNADAQVNLDSLNGRIDSMIDEVNTKTFTYSMNMYWLSLWILLIVDLVFIFVVIKSFCYVFARVLFSEDRGTYISLQPDGEEMKNGQIRKAGNRYIIPAHTTSNFFVSRRYEPSGRAPKIAIPQLGKALFRRLINRAWTMNEVIMGDGRSEVTFNASGGKEFVEWELEEGEVVIFSFKDFVAMSEGVQLNTLVSLRVSSLLLGRIFFTTATGSGTLVLSSKGNPIAGEEETTGTGSVPENRMLAWQQNARFFVESELNIFDVFFSGVYLKKQEEDLVIIDSDQVGKSQSGIFKFFVHFLLPG